MAEKIPPIETPVRRTRTRVLKQNQNSENTLRRKKLVPLARREEPPRAIRAL